MLQVLVILPHRVVSVLQMLVLIDLIPRVHSVEISRINLKVGKILRHQLHAGLVARVMGVVELARVLLLQLLMRLWWVVLGGSISIEACCLLWRLVHGKHLHLVLLLG